MVPLRIACPKCSGDHVQLIDLGMTCSHCGAEVRVVDERVTAERERCLAIVRELRGVAADGDVVDASLLRIAEQRIAEGK